MGQDAEQKRTRKNALPQVCDDQAGQGVESQSREILGGWPSQGQCNIGGGRVKCDEIMRLGIDMRDETHKLLSSHSYSLYEVETMSKKMTAVVTPKKTAIATPNHLAKISMTLAGKRPGMLMDTAANIDFGSTGRKKDVREPRVRAEERLYIGANGHAGKIVLPVNNLVACFVEGGRLVKEGKRAVAGLLAGAMDFDTDEFLLIHNSWEVFESTPTNSTGSRSQKYMPIFNEWRVDINVELDCEIVGVDKFRATVDFAGKLVGLGPMRPQRRRMHGRFLVTKWEVD